MDNNHFRKISSPNPYASYKNVNVQLKQFELPNMTAPDNRYPKWPAQMSDGRLATNYNNHCSQNVPAGKQFPTKRWLINNGNSIIDYTRRTQLPHTKQLDKSVVPNVFAQVKCEKNGCTIQNYDENGIGIERIGNNTPELFGTYMLMNSIDKPSNAHVTKHFEGGRNTIRGTYSNLEEIYHLKKKDDYL
jgi:hypothetical protein